MQEKGLQKTNVVQPRPADTLRSLHGVGGFPPEPPAKQINSQLFNWAVYGALITADGDCSHEIKRLLGKVMINLDSILKSRYYFANKGPSSQGYGFSSSHVWI